MMPVFSCALSERDPSAEMVNDWTSIGFWIATYHIINPAKERLGVPFVVVEEVASSVEG